MLKHQTAIFAAGCFWGVQAFFDQLPGVLATTVGYTGGHSKNPSYRAVCAGDTGHAEAIKIDFDPAAISYEALCDQFFSCHNPTTLNRQGPDVGEQYRSAIFYLDENQKQAAERALERAQKARDDSKAIVTEITAAAAFYPAEDYHQKYFAKQGGGSCRF